MAEEALVEMDGVEFIARDGLHPTVQGESRVRIVSCNLSAGGI
jgi:hypothetical protein